MIPRVNLPNYSSLGNRDVQLTRLCNPESM
jgi:hypothetical protein